MAVNLKDIASRAKVSVTTVSRVVNHNDTSICSEDTQKLIWSLVKETGYTPRVKNKKTEETGSAIKIGYVLGDAERVDDPYFAQMLKGIEAEAFQCNVSIPFVCFTPSLYNKDEFRNMLEESKVQAVIFMASEILPIYDVLKNNKEIYTVFAGVDLLNIDESADYVGVDFYNDTMNWLKDKLFSRFEQIGYVGFASTSRYTAYRDVHQLLGKPIREDLIILTDGWSADKANQAMSQFLENGGQIPKAIFASSDFQAIGAIAALKQFGLKVPEDVNVLGFDNIDMAGYVSPPLTTIEIPKFNIGRAAVRTAIERIKGERDYPYRKILPTQFIQRDSL